MEIVVLHQNFTETARLKERGEREGERREREREMVQTHLSPTFQLSHLPLPLP